MPVVRALSKLDPFGFGVATVSEGRELRDAGVRHPVIVFTPLLPAELPHLRDAQLLPTLSTASGITSWMESGGGPWHLAIDTGLSRAGVRWDCIGEIADIVRRFPPDGAFRRTPSFWNVVRPGVFLYGVGSGARAPLQPEPVVHLRARIVELHDLHVGESVGYDATWRAARRSRVATLAVGYADGLHKSMGNNDLLTVEAVADRAALSPYEVLTGLRQRITRIAS